MDHKKVGCTILFSFTKKNSEEVEVAGIVSKKWRRKVAPPPLPPQLGLGWKKTVQPLSPPQGGGRALLSCTCSSLPRQKPHLSFVEFDIHLYCYLRRCLRRRRRTKNWMRRGGCYGGGGDGVGDAHVLDSGASTAVGPQPLLLPSVARRAPCLAAPALLRPRDEPLPPSCALALETPSLAQCSTPGAFAECSKQNQNTTACSCKRY